MIMNRIPKYLFITSIVFILSASIISYSKDGIEEEFAESVKVSLRDVGHQLLLTNQDSTSVILPVIALDNSRYKLSFQNKLSFEPGNLVAIIKRSFEKAALPNNYRVEVLNCSDKEVAYSYQIVLTEEKSIIPCAGRFLPINCYTIEVKFINRTTPSFSNKFFLYFLIFSAVGLLFFLFNKKKQVKSAEEINENYKNIGSYRFYSQQNKLVKEAIEINLSKKECELLEIFVAKPNQIIKREELTKKVWEDNGVFVGRSLDTYISKLRKKLQEDTSIKLVNIHGVGYKLEIE